MGNFKKFLLISKIAHDHFVIGFIKVMKSFEDGIVNAHYEQSGSFFLCTHSEILP